jgi:hypothetical protein
MGRVTCRSREEGAARLLFSTPQDVLVVPTHSPRFTAGPGQRLPHIHETNPRPARHADTALACEEKAHRMPASSRDGRAPAVRRVVCLRSWAIDFEHTEDALKGKTWKGIYVLDSDTLTICDNAPNLHKDPAGVVRDEERLRVRGLHVQACGP